MVLLLYFFIVQPQQSSAFLPLVINPATIGAVLFVAGAITYYAPKMPLPSNWLGKTQITSAGDIARVMIGSQMVLDQYNRSVLAGNVCALKIQMDKLQDYLLSDSAITQAHPLLARVLIGGGTHVADESRSIGEVIHMPYMDNGPYYTVESRTVYNGSFGGSSTSSAEPQKGPNGEPANIDLTYLASYGNYSVLYGWKVSGDGGYYEHSAQYHVRQGGTPKAKTKNTATQAKAVIAADQGSNGEVFPDNVTEELDGLIGSVPPTTYGASVIDSAVPGTVDTSPELFPPAVVPNVISAAPTVTGINAPTVEAAKTGETTAAGTKVQASTALDVYKAAHPDATVQTDTALKDLVAAFDKAVADAAAATKARESAEAADNEVYLNASSEERKALNFEKLKALSGIAGGVFPFNQILRAGTFYSMLIAAPVPPVFTFPLPLGFVINIDLTPWDPVARVCRYMFGLLLGSGVIFYVVRFWRGVA